MPSKPIACTIGNMLLCAAGMLGNCYLMSLFHTKLVAYESVVQPTVVSFFRPKIYNNGTRAEKVIAQPVF